MSLWSFFLFVVIALATFGVGRFGNSKQAQELGTLYLCSLFPTNSSSVNRYISKLNYPTSLSARNSTTTTTTAARPKGVRPAAPQAVRFAQQPTTIPARPAAPGAPISAQLKPKPTISRANNIANAKGKLGVDSDSDASSDDEWKPIP